ncbi:MAG: hypothetical protein JNJ46_07005 [Myxococcales bacterium]|nr:hypothetical protein [Myxococcales bacterium]
MLDRKAVDSGEHSRQLLAASILASLRALEQAVAGDGDPALSIAQVAPALSGFAAGPASGVDDSTLGIPSAADEALRTAVPWLRQGRWLPALRVQPQTSSAMSGDRWDHLGRRADLGD